MDTIRVIFEFALPVLSVAVILGGGLALFKGSYNRARIQALEDENAKQAKKIELLEVKEDRLEQEVEQLKKEREYLLIINSQQSNFDGLNKKFDKVLKHLGILNE